MDIFFLRQTFSWFWSVVSICFQYDYLIGSNSLFCSGPSVVQSFWLWLCGLHRLIVSKWLRWSYLKTSFYRREIDIWTGKKWKARCSYPHAHLSPCPWAHGLIQTSFLHDPWLPVELWFVIQSWLRLESLSLPWQTLFFWTWTLPLFTCSGFFSSFGLIVRPSLTLGTCIYP